MFMRSSGAARLAAIGAAVIVLAAVGSGAATSADFAGSCCADLADRIAELEATTARKGNQKVEVKVLGVVNRALLFWDDGVEHNVYGVDSPQDGSAILFEGEVDIGRGWKAGFVIGLDALVSSSDTLDQLVDSSHKVEVSDVYWWVSHDKYGTVRLGLTDTASDGVDNINLAESDAAADVEVGNWLASFFLRAGDGELLDVRWGDFIPSVAGDTVNTVTYVSPIYKGLEFSASAGKDDFRDVGLRYSETWAKSIIVRAAVGYYRNTTEEEPDAIEPLEDSGVGASLAFRHIPTGLNIGFNYGWQDHTDRCEEPGQVSGKCRGDDNFYYVKGGLVREWSSLGPTAFYGEYYLGKRRFNESDPDALGALLSAPGDFDVDPDNPDPTKPVAELRDSTVRVWGFGVVQKIGEDILIGSDEPKEPGEKKEYAGVWEEAPIELYLGYRHYEIDVDLISSDGGPAQARKLKDFDAVMGGLVIRF